MSEYNFPEQRFVQAGVPQSDIDQMRRGFNSSDLTIQRARCEFWQDKPFTALLDFVQTMRDNGEIVSSETSESPSQSSESTSDDDSDDSATKDDESHADDDSESSDDDDPHIGD